MASMIDAIEDCPHVMPYIHLPIQAGSNKILKLMNRSYTKEEYLALYKKIRERVTSSVITTDIIVGFPGETEKDFEETIEMVDKCKFDGAYTFIYSPRENTPAARLKDDTPLTVKEERLHKLNEKINEYSNASNQKLLGKIEEVLVLGISEKDSSKYMGYTRGMKLVNIESDIDIIGQIVNVEITEAKSFSLDGKLVK